MKRLHFFIVLCLVLVLFLSPSYTALADDHDTQTQDIDTTTGLPISTETTLSVSRIVSASVAGGNILWDTSHGIYLAYSPSGYFSNLKSILEGRGYTIDENSTGILGLDLSQYDIIVISLGSAWNSVYSSAEVAAIQGFLDSGGGLLILSENTGCPNSNINPVSLAYGTTVGTGSIGSTISNFAAHQIFDGVTQVSFSAGGAISGSAPSVEVAWDVSSIPAVTVSEDCGWRVVVIGDNNIFDNSQISAYDNQLLAENVFDWLIKYAENCGGNGPDPGLEVGGKIQPTNKVVLLIPWITLGILLSAWSTIFIRRSRSQN
ncbi:MAG: hypothetical protein JW762_10375 [Dehalococcoidales bacterium]|nr:hypothetical protein [Dehalococcoidales bacterium]